MATAAMVPMIGPQGDQLWVQPNDIDSAKGDGYEVAQFVQKGNDTRLIRTSDLGFALRDLYKPVTTRQYLSSKVGFDANALPSNLTVDASGQLQPQADTIPLRLAPEDAEAERLANQPAWTSVAGVPVPVGVPNYVNTQANEMAAKQIPFIVAGEGAGVIGEAANLARFGKLGTLGMAALQGLGQAGASALTGGNATQNTIAGATGAASELTVPILKALALKRMTQAMQPGGLADKAIAQRIAPEMLARRQVFTSAEQLAARAAQNGSEAGQSLNDAVSNLVTPGQTLSGGQIAGDSQDAITAALRARVARQQIGSAGNTIPTALTGPTSRLVDELGTQAATIPESILRPIQMPDISTLPQATRDAVEPVIQKLQGIKSSFALSTGASVQPEVAARADELINQVTQLAQNGTARTEDLLKLKRALDEGQPGTSFIPNLSGQKVLTPVGNLESAAADSIRGIINDSHPDVAAANKAIHFWKQVSDVAGGTANRGIGKLAPLGLASVAGIAGYAHGGPAAGVEWATAVGGALHVMRSPAWLSTTAVVRNELADALAGGNAQRVAAVVNGIQAGRR